MFDPEAISEHIGRRNLIAVVMLVVLAAAVGLAWAITRGPGASADRGKKLIAQLHEKGLSAYWSGEPTSLVYEATLPGRPPARLVFIRQPIQDGFKGQTAQRGDLVDISSWALSNDARVGQYSGRSQMETGWAITRITLSEGKVAVVQSVTKGPSARVQGEAINRAPDNYIPEGAMFAVVSVVHEAGESATFEMIDDQSAIEGGQVDFTTVRMSPHGKDEVTLTFPNGKTIYHFDAQGQIDRIQQQFHEGGLVFHLKRVTTAPAPQADEGQTQPDDDLQPAVSPA